jgi:phosphoribosyl-dephospho-CoA transferase
MTIHVAMIGIIITTIIQRFTLQRHVTVIVIVLYVVIPGGINDSCSAERTFETTKRLLEIEN